MLYESIGTEITKRCELLRIAQAGGSRVKLMEFIKMYFKLLPQIPHYFLAEYKCHAIAAISKLRVYTRFSTPHLESFGNRTVFHNGL